MSESPPSPRDETHWARLDRNFNEQLQEVRIAQAGVQILFAFLLTLPFQARFTILSEFQRNLYLVTLLSSAVAVVVFTAPVAMHRVLFRRGVKDFIVSYTSRLTEFGLVALGVSVVGAVTLVLDVLVAHAVALVLGGLIALLAIVLWLVAPELQKQRFSAPLEPDHSQQPKPDAGQEPGQT